MIPPRNEAGFTLVELLVSLAVLGLMAATLLSGLVTGRRAWERVEVRADEGERIAAAQALLRALLERTFPQGEFNGSQPGTVFAGRETRMSFQSAALEAHRPSPPWRYRLALSPGGTLDLDLTPPLARDPAAARVRQTIVEGVDRVEFAYYGSAEPDNVARWRSRWEQQPGLPRMIRIRASFAPEDRRRWPELIAQPAATIDTLCIFDVNSGRCRGR